MGPRETRLRISSLVRVECPLKASSPSMCAQSGCLSWGICELQNGARSGTCGIVVDAVPSLTELVSSPEKRSVKIIFFDGHKAWIKEALLSLEPVNKAFGEKAEKKYNETA